MSALSLDDIPIHHQGWSYTHHPIIVVTAANSVSATASSICKRSPCRLHRIDYLFCESKSYLQSLELHRLSRSESVTVWEYLGSPPFFLYCLANIVFCLINWFVIASCCCRCKNSVLLRSSRLDMSTGWRLNHINRMIVVVASRTRLYTQ